MFVFCDYTVTRWAELLSQQGAWTWRLAVIAVVAPLGIVALGLAASRMGLAAVVGFVNAGVVTGGTLVGVLVRREHLTLTQKIGLATAILAIVLVNIGHANANATAEAP
jgi:drug/metabolite transporter (DMT)-like permease